MSREMHTVRRAIIIAAGIGKRLRPLTLHTPKPLLRVHGKRMIDTAVDALRKNGVREIYVVVGYLKEQFQAWAANQPDIHLIENPYYMECNNISSLYMARNLLEDVMILDGDQLVLNATVLDPNFETSGYNAVWCEGKTDEWLMEVENGRVKRCSRTGGSKGWQLYSVSRWTAEDGAKLRDYVTEEFEAGNRQIYWDDVPMFCHFQDFQLGIWEMRKEDMVEIDDLAELIKIDAAYDFCQP